MGVAKAGRQIEAGHMQRNSMRILCGAWCDKVPCDPMRQPYFPIEFATSRVWPNRPRERPIHAGSLRSDLSFRMKHACSFLRLSCRYGAGTFVRLDHSLATLENLCTPHLPLLVAVVVLDKLGRDFP